MSQDLSGARREVLLCHETDLVMDCGTPCFRVGGEESDDRERLGEQHGYLPFLESVERELKSGFNDETHDCGRRGRSTICTPHIVLDC